MSTVEDLYQRAEIPRKVYEDFQGEYERERKNLESTVDALLERNPEVHR